MELLEVWMPQDLVSSGSLARVEAQHLHNQIDRLARSVGLEPILDALDLGLGDRADHGHRSF